MKFIPVPDISKDTIYEITPEMFTTRGIKLVLIDVDNTIAPYTCDDADERLLTWAQEIKNAGLTLHILSNNPHERPGIFAKALGIDYDGSSKKPFTKTLKKVLARYDVAPCEAALWMPPCI